jgi:hypothetical protein
MTSAPLSLYLELEPDQTADLEVVAKASLAFVATLKEIAYQIDPLLEVRVELESGSKGSLSLNARLRSWKKKYVKPHVIFSITTIFLVYFKDEVRDHVVDKLLDVVIPGFTEEHFSKEQKQEMQQIVEDGLSRRLGKKEAAQIYLELNKDPAIKGVGATNILGAKPDSIVPRSKFPARAGVAPVTETITKRKSEPTLTVTLVKPALEHAKRSWRVSEAGVEFGAVMEDQKFLDDLLTERIRVPMIEGVQLTATFRIEEELSPDGVWVVTSRKIITVHSFKRPPHQTSLLPKPPLRPSVDDDEDDDK